MEYRNNSTHVLLGKTLTTVVSMATMATDSSKSNLKDKCYEWVQTVWAFVVKWPQEESENVIFG